VALIGNYSVLSKHPGRDIGGGAIGLGMNRGDSSKGGMNRGRFSQGSMEPKSGVPDGYRPPYCWVLPQSPGALAARNTLDGTGGISAADAWAVRLAVASLTGAGGITADGGLIVQLAAALVGSGAVTGANLAGFLAAVAALTGEGGVSAGALSGLGAVLAALTGSGTAEGATLTGLGELGADIVSYGDLTVEGMRDAVWSAIAAQYNDAGTMGEKLNDAGSAANPWTEVIEGSYTAAELLRIIAAALAGELSGAATTTITIQGIDGATDRIIATVDSDGNRTSLTLDGS
jgi:hypothetical protein